MNKVILIGTVADRPAPSYTNGTNSTTGAPFQRLWFLIRTKEEFLNRENEVKRFEAGFSVVAWGKLAQLRANIQEGEIVIVEGRLENRKQVDQMGQEKWVTEINASTIETLLDDGPDDRAPTPPARTQQQTQPAPPSPGPGKDATWLDDGDDIPF